MPADRTSITLIKASTRKNPVYGRKDLNKHSTNKEDSSKKTIEKNFACTGFFVPSSKNPQERVPCRFIARDYIDLCLHKQREHARIPRPCPRVIIPTNLNAGPRMALPPIEENQEENPLRINSISNFSRNGVVPAGHTSLVYSAPPIRREVSSASFGPLPQAPNPGPSTNDPPTTFHQQHNDFTNIPTTHPNSNSNPIPTLPSLPPKNHNPNNIRLPSNLRQERVVQGSNFQNTTNVPAQTRFAPTTNIYHGLDSTQTYTIGVPAQSFSTIPQVPTQPIIHIPSLPQVPIPTHSAPYFTLPQALLPNIQPTPMTVIQRPVFIPIPMIIQPFQTALGGVRIPSSTTMVPVSSFYSVPLLVGREGVQVMPVDPWEFNINTDS